MSRADRSVYRRTLTMRMGARAKALTTLANKYPAEYQEEYAKELKAIGLTGRAPKRIKVKNV